MLLQLLNHLVNCVEADGGERLDGSMGQCHLSSHRDDEVQVPEAYVCPRYPANTMASDPWPDVNVGIRKGPYLAHQLSMFRVNTNE